MIRILFFSLLVLGLGFGFSWLADRPGELSVVWQGQLIEMSLMVAATALVSLVAALMISWWLLRTLWTSPQTLTRYFRARKRDRGYQALSTGLIAAGAGDAALARKMNARAKGLIRADQEPLIHLLEAQANLIEGRSHDARRKFEQMAEDPETRELGLRGLYLEAKRLGAEEAASQFAEKAAAKAPHLPWAAEATLETQTKSGQFNEALVMLDQYRISGAITKAEVNEKKAVLLTARAASKLENEVKSARTDAMLALRLLPDCVPAGIIAAKALFREKSQRKALAVLEQVWKSEPHPDIAALYVRGGGADTATDRLKRAKRLESLQPGTHEALASVAAAALDTRDFPLAREKAQAAAQVDLRESIFLLLADIEEEETGDQARVRHWLAQARHAPKDPAWVADGYVSQTWLPVSPISGRLNAFEWKKLEANTGGLISHEPANADKAFATLPALPLPSEVIEPEPADMTIEAEEQAASAPETPKQEAESTPAKPEAQKTDAADKETSFTRPPDDPGVKGPVEPENKTRLKLF